MSTPPFIAMPDGVAVLGPPQCPAPILLAEPAGSGTPGSAPTGDGAPGGTPGSGGAPQARDVKARGDVLLVPGFTGSKEDFIAVLRPLADVGWRVAAMDLPGQAGSPGLGPHGAHTLASLAQAVLAVADWLAPDRPVHLVGHSMGGLVTRELLLTSPGRLASWTAMSSGPGPAPAHTHTPLLQLQAALAHLPMDQLWARKEAQDRAAGWDPPSAEVADFCARRFIANDPVALADMAEILMTAPDRTAEAAKALDVAGIPAAVVTGAMDDAWPVSQQEAMAEHLRVPWLVVAEVGHNPAVEDPAATAAVLDSVFSAPPPDRADPQQ